jgi:hypothetical protein
MDVSRLDGLTRRLSIGHSRRSLTRLFGAFGFTGPLSLLGPSETEARKKCPPCKKRKQGKCKAKKPDGTACAGGTCQRGICQPSPQCPSPSLQCPAGHEACAGVCCSPDKNCVAGSCQCTTPCGAVCCLDGQICLNANTHTCGCDALSCPVGCDCGVAAGGMRVCYESALTDCEEVQFCASNFECPVGSACNLTVCASPICFPLCTT